MSYHSLDTRDLYDRMAELEELQEDEALDTDDLAELEALLDLADEIGEEFSYGAHMIACGDFTEYARELAEDIGAIPDDYTWPTSCIDWERAAHDLSMDYTLVTYDGEDYYVRP
jgi:antirestriction protein